MRMSWSVYHIRKEGCKLLWKFLESWQGCSGRFHIRERALKHRLEKQERFQGQAEPGGEAYILDSASSVTKRTAYSQRAASTDRKVVGTKLWSVKTNITHPEEQNNAICSDTDGPRDRHPE